MGKLTFNMSRSQITNISVQNSFQLISCILDFLWAEKNVPVFGPDVTVFKYPSQFISHVKVNICCTIMFLMLT